MRKFIILIAVASLLLTGCGFLGYGDKWEFDWDSWNMHYYLKNDQFKDNLTAAYMIMV